MMKRYIAFALMVILLAMNHLSVYACDENQSNTHVEEILFGDDALTYASDDNVKMLLNAVYLCCEQSDSNGQDKIDYLKSKKVKKVPSIKDINIKTASWLNVHTFHGDMSILQIRKPGQTGRISLRIL